jgi:hypothetical protein
VGDGCDDFTGSGNVKTLDRKAALVMTHGPDESVRIKMNSSGNVKKSYSMKVLRSPCYE